MILASCGQDGTARLWDVASGKSLRVLRGHAHDVNWVEFSPDGRTLATASEDTAAKLWDAATGEPLRTLTGHQVEVVSARFTPDGRRLVTCDRDGHVFVWDVATGSQQLSFDTQIEYIEAMAIYPDGKSLLVAGNGAGVWNLTSGAKTLTITDDPAKIRDVVYHIQGESARPGQHLGTTSDKSIRWWDAVTGKPVNQWHFGGEAPVVSISCNRTRVAWIDEHGLVESVDYPMAGYQGRIPTGQSLPWSLSLSSDKRTLATASRDGTVKLWDITQDCDRRIYPADRIGEVSSFAFSADSKRVSAFGNEGKVLTWGTSGGELLSSRSIPVPAKLAWAELSRDGATLATLSEDRSCQVWDVASGSLIRSIENATTAGGMQLSHDGKWLSAPVTDAGKMRRIRVWNTENGGEFQSATRTRSSRGTFPRHGAGLPRFPLRPVRCALRTSPAVESSRRAGGATSARSSSSNSQRMGRWWRQPGFIKPSQSGMPTPSRPVSRSRRFPGNESPGFLSRWADPRRLQRLTNGHQDLGHIDGPRDLRARATS